MFQVEDNLLLDQKDCPICFGKSKQIDILGTINKGSDEMVMLRECDVCTHWWINPLPKQELLSHWYGIGSGFVISPLNYSGTSPDDVHSEKIFLRLTNLYKSPDFNYLEIGCGTGNLLKFFSKTAKIAYGVEPGSWGAKDGLNIISDISLLPDNVKFDIVVLGDVLEHVSDPNDMIKKVSEVANKNAIIYMNFPNKDSMKARMMKGRWGMALPFGHVNFFSSKSVNKLCERNGLEILSKKATRAGGENAIGLIKKFDLSAPKILFRLVKSLFLGQIILGKDQWDIILIKK